MELSTRLSALVQYVPKGSSVIDVGTDHAYIPIYLMKTGQAVRCLATDINAGPLRKAAHNMRSYGISDIRLKQTNGLEGITAADGDVIMISGMGGYLIIDILERAKVLVKGIKKLILQPQQDIDQVRKYLHQIGFRIEDEDFVVDDEKYYTVIVATLGQECYAYDYEYVYGKCLIEKGLPVFKEWLIKKEEKLIAIRESISHIESESVAKRKEELEAELAMHREVMACLF